MTNKIINFTGYAILAALILSITYLVIFESNGIVRVDFLIR